MNPSTRDLTKWPEIMKLYEELARPENPWIFRGQARVDDHLTTTLERDANRFELDPSELPVLEDALVRHFRRQAHRYLANVPQDENIIEWLALMRHYGAPTRLMDWTYSFFVALYFAVERAEKDCAVWAMNFNAMRKKAEPLFSRRIAALRRKDSRLKSGDFFKRVFRKQPPYNLVYPLNPERLNERLIIQQGVFLAPGNIKNKFEQNLDSLFKGISGKNPHVLKLTVHTTDKKFKNVILRHLHRMNITRATLFPGLGGFAESLATYLANPDILKGRKPFDLP